MLRTLRLQLRFLLPLACVMVLAAYAALPVMDRMTLRWSMRDMNQRGALVANALSDSIAEAIDADATPRLHALLERAARDERVYAIGVCRGNGSAWVRTAAYPASLACAALRDAASRNDARLPLPGGEVLASVHALDEVPGADRTTLAGTQLVLLHDLSFVAVRSQDTRRHLLLFLAGLGIVLALLTMLVAQLSWRGWMRGARAMLRGDFSLDTPPPLAAELAPLAQDLRQRMRELEDEYRRAHVPQAGWTPERLRALLHAQLRGDEIIVVSNREPYLHEHTPQGVVVRQPASGLVTAVEPVMRACSGTWIAHGSGSADRDVVDARDRVAVPPGEADYALRRIWLSEQEEQGYYYGFANEGLWPLCHIAHVRPVFRESDWEAYRAVNQRFADAVAEEARTDDPIVLVQDYHFALLPAMVRARLPRATILTFWHIPWPNPESFGICPWRRELLAGLLGSDIVGFHTRFHCRNFMESVDRYLEARIEQEHSMVTVDGKDTIVESYPISIAWPDAAGWEAPEECRRRVDTWLELPEGACLALGVDRFDYTKGIVERLNAVERLLEKHPDLRGRFHFVQVASPTRASLDEYQQFQAQVRRLVDRINARFGGDGYTPVRLLDRHFEHAELNALYRAADICVVTSLHDGMNLVCKEFIAARDDERGALVLSRFAGAARELREALIVNPYHVEETADALYHAATMPPEEQRERMASLRHTVCEANVFRWAGRMLTDASHLRLRARVAARVQGHRYA